MMSLLRDIFHYFLIKRFEWLYKNTKIVSNYFGASVRGFYSQDGQDSFIYSEFYHHINKNNFPKIFLDIGCNHPVKYSNSMFFEETLKFKVIGIDPLPTYAADWKKLRPLAEMHTLALGIENSEMTLLVPDDGYSSGSHPADMFSTLDKKNNRLSRGKWNESTITVRRSQDFLDDLDVSDIGILSIDVEGFELNVLSGFDFSRTNVHIAIVENNLKSRFGSDEIRKYMIESGFSFYARFWGLDDVYINRNLVNRDEY